MRTLVDWIDGSMDSWADGAILRPNNPKIPPSSNPIHHFHQAKVSAAAEPMRWALAMTEKVICVAGTSGNTEASTI
jgi:hypothetical protein